MVGEEHAVVEVDRRQANPTGLVLLRPPRQRVRKTNISHCGITLELLRHRDSSLEIRAGLSRNPGQRPDEAAIVSFLFGGRRTLVVDPVVEVDLKQPGVRVALLGNRHSDLVHDEGRAGVLEAVVLPVVHRECLGQSPLELHVQLSVPDRQEVIDMDCHIGFWLAQGPVGIDDVELEDGALVKASTPAVTELDGEPEDRGLQLLVPSIGGVHKLASCTICSDIRVDVASNDEPGLALRSTRE